MKDTDASILIIEDSPTLSKLYKSYLEDQSYQLALVDTGQDALNSISQHTYDIVLLDLQLPDMNGIDILKSIHQRKLPCSVIIITSHGSVESVVETMSYGALDYLEKPFNANRLLTTVQNALKNTQLEKQLQTLKDNFERNKFVGFVGQSTPMQRVYNIIESAAPSKATVFVTGESGTGKEVCAEAIHKLSPRKGQPLVALNCGAIPKDLMESEIFGHIKGAFTGAVAPRQGAAERANKGTLFLDEICEMDMDLQVKLLRFIQTGTYQKVGSSEMQKVDVRFVCATNRDPLKEVEAGRFREDLYYRLHVIPIPLPPLREREADIIMLARHFLKLYAKEEEKPFSQFTPKTEVVLNSFHWPGNIRQLQNVIRNIIVLNDGDTVDTEMLPPPLNDLTQNIQVRTRSAAPIRQEEAISDNPISHDETNYEIASTMNDASTSLDSAFKPQTHDAIQPLWMVEKNVIERAIALCDGNIPQAAAQLEVSPSTIYRKKQQWDSM
ncbi:sigma-54-dependent transcriptional regulator [Marinomonas transparens]|uniref:Sigma-54-dependent Fis family transcriptional regulator n=1 Tax=Marinomonas transparens TaxID=2795388 RepID=A0A934JW25_9GAMM|nr:sigma-54 dependent transcriptional regulator [Marinomonas transparens]MBJ7538264.1 sigma-54-dependent Fis family transcriptional regulator [Marinomonas transparens]